MILKKFTNIVLSSMLAIGFIGCSNKDDYIGTWKSSNSDITYNLLDNGTCQVMIDNEVEADISQCKWDTDTIKALGDTGFLKLDGSSVLLVSLKKEELTIEEASLKLIKQTSK